jgi:Rrf2 family transcriptional regulator, cysteine metabolism repressor
MFRVSQKVEVALRALMELAARHGSGFIPAREIAEAQDISLRFLEHQLATLHKADIVASQRGAAGGVALARSPEQIRVIDIIEALEGPLAPMHCLEPHDDSCDITHKCGLQELWSRVEVAVHDVFTQTSLADLIARHRALQPLLWPTLLTSPNP